MIFGWFLKTFFIIILLSSEIIYQIYVKYSDNLLTIALFSNVFKFRNEKMLT